MNKEDMMFSAIRKKDILPLVTVWMKPEGILLSKIGGQRKSNTM